MYYYRPTTMSVIIGASKTVPGENAMVRNMVRLAAASIAKSPRASLSAKLALAAVLLFAAAAAQAEPQAAACSKSYAPATLQHSQPLNLGQLKNQLYFYACSGAYDRDLNTVQSAAKAYVEMRAAQVTKPALVLDIDETSLSNLPEELADDFGYIQDGSCDHLPKGPCGSRAWELSGRAKAFDGTLALFNAAKAHHVSVFFITGRAESKQLRDATEKNLKAAGYDGWAGLTLRPASTHNMTVAGYKSGEREKIAANGYTIIANMGDQQSDLDGGFTERAYKLPNPFYYIP
jgi:predicted secreted acid phosphatase